MKIKVEYTSEMIKKLIIDDLDRKLNGDFDEKDIEIKVRSKQNYREKDWERGELKVEMEVDV
jgi:hypothetical protein